MYVAQKLKDVFRGSVAVLGNEVCEHSIQPKLLRIRSKVASSVRMQHELKFDSLQLRARDTK